MLSGSSKGLFEVLLRQLPEAATWKWSRATKSAERVVVLSILSKIKEVSVTRSRRAADPGRSRTMSPRAPRRDPSTRPW